MKRAGLIISMMILILLWGIAVQADYGTNWSGAFYNNTSFSDPDVATVTSVNGLSFNWPDQPTVSGTVTSGSMSDVNADNFSVRFTSTQSFQAATYLFELAIDDNVRVFIDGEQVLEDNSGGPVKNLSFTRTMTSGTHTLRVDFVEVSEEAVLQFQWSQEGSTEATSAVPTATAIPPLTATVSGSVSGLAVRTGPYLGASMVTVALTGTEYPVLARNPSETGVTWYRIDVGGRVGWASGRYLEFSTDPGGLGVVGSVFDTLDSPAATGVGASPRAVMNLRVRPSTRTTIIGSVPWGAEMPLLNRTVQGGQDRWYQVLYEGQIGWIFAPFVNVGGDIRDVPIR